MSVGLIFKIAAVGIAFLISLAGLILVLTWLIPYIYDLFVMVQDLFTL